MSQQPTPTPSPWTYEKNPLTAHTFNVYADGLRVCEVVSGDAVFTEPKYGCPEFIGTRGEANARLIAASPDQNSALIKAESFISGFEDDETQEGISELLAEIRSAIATARG